jgi:WhiB family redox-sensing transcriptional regulator
VATVKDEARYQREVGAAKSVCATCPVVEACLWFAVENAEPFGVWGGHTPEERRPLVRKHRAGQAHMSWTPAGGWEEAG